MTIKKTINQEMDKIVENTVKTFTSLKWSESKARELQPEVKDIDIDEVDGEIEDLEKRIVEKGIDEDIAIKLGQEIEDLKEKKTKHAKLLEHLENIDKAKEALEDNRLSYRSLSKGLQEITKLLT